MQGSGSSWAVRWRRTVTTPSHNLLATSALKDLAKLLLVFKTSQISRSLRRRFPNLDLIGAKFLFVLIPSFINWSAVGAEYL